MKLNNKTYDILKWIALIVLPATAAAYTGLAILWGFPYGEQIAGTIGIVETFLGAILQVSNINYKKSLNEGGK